MSEPGARGPDVERILAATRGVAAMLAATPFALLSAALLAPSPAPSRVLVAPAALAGLVALAAGNRWYRAILDRIAQGTRPADCAAALRKATIAGLACTEAASFLAVIAYHVSREPFALVGLAAHLILAGALWPTRARCERILEGTESSAADAGPR